jgi:hypothetical protein
MAELCIVLLGISSMTVLCLPSHEFQEEAYCRFGDEYLLKQSEAIVNSARTEYISGSHSVIIFNEHGNISRADTAVLGNRKREIVMELGGGRLVFR